MRTRERRIEVLRRAFSVALLAFLHCQYQVNPADGDMSSTASPECLRDQDCPIGQSCSVARICTTPTAKKPDMACPDQCCINSDCQDGRRCSTLSKACVFCYSPLSLPTCVEHASLDIDSAIGDVWGNAPDDVWAVGQENRLVSQIFHFTGSHWTEVTHPEQRALLAVHGTRSDDVWAVGAQGSILHLDASGKWSDKHAGLTTEDLISIWAADREHAFTVSTAGSIFVFDKGSWTRTTTGENLTTIYGIDGTILAGGKGCVLQRDAVDPAKWNKIAIPWLDASLKVERFFGTARDDIWMVGHGTVATMGFLAHYTGGTWNRVKTYNNFPLYAIWGTDAQHLWLAGDRKIARMSETNFEEVSGLPPGLRLFGLWGSGATNVWLGGLVLQVDSLSGTIWSYGRILHFPQ